MKDYLLMVKLTLNRKRFRHLFCALAVCCLSTVVHEAVAQCGPMPIQGFDVIRIDDTTGGANNGTIAVAVRGGQGPFVYTLVADYGGKGKQVVRASRPLEEQTFTFRDVAANTDSGMIGYSVEVQSSNEHQMGSLEAVCRKRAIFNIEVK